MSRLTACHPTSGTEMKSGAGLAALLTFQGDGESELVRVIDRIDLVTPYYLLMHRDMQNTPRVRAFADFVASEIKCFRAMISGEASVPADSLPPRPREPSRLRRKARGTATRLHASE